MIDYDALRTYIETETDGLGTVAPWNEGNNGAVLALLNGTSHNAFVRRSSRELLTFVTATGIFGKILGGTTSPDLMLSGTCEAARIMITREDTHLDLNDDDHLNLVQGLAAGGIITGTPGPTTGNPDPAKNVAGNDDLDRIVGFCSQKTGYFEAIHGRPATLEDIRLARPPA